MKIIKKIENDLIYPCIPMGAIKPNVKELEEAIEDENYVAEIKYDGYRMLSWIGSSRVRFTTRSIAIESVRQGNPMPTERTENIPHLNGLNIKGLDGTIADGEIWKDNCRSHDITSMIGGLQETSLNNQIEKGFVIYKMYDILQYKGESVRDKPYTERRLLLEKLYSELLDLNKDWKYEHPITKEILCKNIKDYLKISEVIPHENKRIAFDQIIKNGGEGIILKCKSSIYYEGKIDKNGKGVPAKVKANKRKGIPYTPWIKWKKSDTIDCVIMGFSSATVDYTGNEVDNWQYWLDNNTGSKYLIDFDTSVGMSIANDDSLDLIPITKFYFYDWPGAIIFGQYDKKGKLIEVGQTSGIVDDMRKEFAEHPEKYVGRVCEVECMEQLKSPTYALREPRFIRIREEWDKPASECTLP